MPDFAIAQYDNILTFHGQELQHDTSLKLAQLAQADAAGNRDMAVLADLTYKDSRSMRIATAIAMFYLPVNLVMVRILTFLNFYTSLIPWESGVVRFAIRSKACFTAQLTSGLPTLVILQQYTCLVWDGRRCDRKQ
jgi:hypothetical protein